jgi:hypothetical protein
MIVLGSAFLSGATAYAASHLMSPTYKAEVVLLSLRDAGGFDLTAAFGEKLDGPGALAGPGLGGDTERNARLATLTSRALADRAVEMEDRSPHSSDADVINSASAETGFVANMPKTWDSDALRVFQHQVLCVTEDERMGLVCVSTIWNGGKKKAYWANCFMELHYADKQHLRI